MVLGEGERYSGRIHIVSCLIVKGSGNQVQSAEPRCGSHSVSAGVSLGRRLQLGPREAKRWHSSKLKLFLSCALAPTAPVAPSLGSPCTEQGQTCTTGKRHPDQVS